MSLENVKANFEVCFYSFFVVLLKHFVLLAKYCSHLDCSCSGKLWQNSSAGVVVILLRLLVILADVENV